MSTDFASYLSSFFTVYVDGTRGLSKNTIKSYAQTFALLLQFISEVRKINIDKITLSVLDQQLILDFLDWLEKIRGCQPPTRNVRLAGLKTFFGYISTKEPKSLHQSLQVLSIPAKKISQKVPSYVSTEGMRQLFEQFNLKARMGRRDFALIALLYDSGSRVQELIDLTPSSIDFKKPIYLTVVGKGRKTRTIPLLSTQVNHLQRYMDENGLLEPSKSAQPLFSNCQGRKLTRQGIADILRKYLKKARAIDPTLISEKITCHSLRHSKAIHLLEAGVPLAYIREFLGHRSVQTTERYARLTTKYKQAVLEAANKELFDLIPETQAYRDSAKSELLKLVSSFT